MEGLRHASGLCAVRSAGRSTLKCSTTIYPLGLMLDSPYMLIWLVPKSSCPEQRRTQGFDRQAYAPRYLSRFSPLRPQPFSTCKACSNRMCEDVQDQWRNLKYETGAVASSSRRNVCDTMRQETCDGGTGARILVRFELRNCTRHSWVWASFRARGQRRCTAPCPLGELQISYINHKRVGSASPSENFLAASWSPSLASRQSSGVEKLKAANSNLRTWPFSTGSCSSWHSTRRLL